VAWRRVAHEHSFAWVATVAAIVFGRSWLALPFDLSVYLLLPCQVGSVARRALRWLLDTDIRLKRPPVRTWRALVRPVRLQIRRSMSHLSCSSDAIIFAFYSLSGAPLRNHRSACPVGPTDRQLFWRLAMLRSAPSQPAAELQSDIAMGPLSLNPYRAASARLREYAGVITCSRPRGKILWPLLPASMSRRRRRFLWFGCADDTLGCGSNPRGTLLPAGMLCCVAREASAPRSTRRYRATQHTLFEERRSAEASRQNPMARRL